MLQSLGATPAPSQTREPKGQALILLWPAIPSPDQPAMSRFWWLPGVPWGEEGVSSFPSLHPIFRSC